AGHRAIARRPGARPLSRKERGPASRRLPPSRGDVVPSNSWRNGQLLAPEHRVKLGPTFRGTDLIKTLLNLEARQFVPGNQVAVDIREVEGFSVGPGRQGSRVQNPQAVIDVPHLASLLFLAVAFDRAILEPDVARVPAAFVSINR